MYAIQFNYVSALFCTPFILTYYYSPLIKYISSPRPLELDLYLCPNKCLFV